MIRLDHIDKLEKANGRLLSAVLYLVFIIFRGGDSNP